MEGVLKQTWGPGNCTHCHHGALHTEEQHAEAILAAHADEDRCPKSESGEHEPDPNTLTVADYDPGLMVVDVNCQLCGRSGSVQIQREDILW